MAANPSDILNEVLAASNKIAASQLDSVKTLNGIQDKISDRSKKLSKTIRNTIDQLDLFAQEQKQKKDEKKNDWSILSFIKNTSLLLEKTTKKKSVKELIKKENSNEKHYDKVTITNSNLTVRGNLFVNSKSFKVPVDIAKSKQSSEDFYRTDDSDYMSEELELLKSIESKLNFSGTGGAGIFDALFGGISGLVKLFTGASTLGLGGIAGAMFKLPKFKQLGNLLKPLSKLKTGFGSLTGARKLLNNPKMIIPLVIGASAVGIYDALKIREAVKSEGGSPLDDVGNAEQRQNGGRVFSGKPYIVGEQGPELFTPRETGRIIPNNKLLSHGDKYRSEDTAEIDRILDLVREQNKLSSNTFDFFTESFDKVLDFFKPSNLLELIKKSVKGMLGRAGEKIRDVSVKVKNKAVNLINNASDVGNKGLNFVGLGNVFQFGKLPNVQPQAAPARRIGDKNVPRDMSVTLHKNEMVIPAAPSETLRAVAKLQNQNLSTSQLPQYTQRSQLGKEFWMDEFVPKFASIISTKQPDNRLRSYSIGNVFGVP